MFWRQSNYRTLSQYSLATSLSHRDSWQTSTSHFRLASKWYCTFCQQHFTNYWVHNISQMELHCTRMHKSDVCLQYLTTDLEHDLDHLERLRRGGEWAPSLLWCLLSTWCLEEYEEVLVLVLESHLWKNNKQRDRLQWCVQTNKAHWFSELFYNYLHTGTTSLSLKNVLGK